MLGSLSKIYTSFFLLLIVGCGLQDTITVSYSNPKIVYNGRIDTTKVDGAELYWSGTSIKIKKEYEKQGENKKSER